MEDKQQSHSDHPISPSKTDELLTFLFLTIVLAPILAVVTVGGYGLVIWMIQLLAGPPGT